MPHEPTSQAVADDAMRACRRVLCVSPWARKGNTPIAVAAASASTLPGPVQLASVQRLWYSP